MTVPERWICFLAGTVIPSVCKTRRISRHMIPRRLLVACISTLVIVGGGVLVFASRAPITVPQEVVINEPTLSATPVVRRWIDGQPLTEGATQPVAAAVIIDNAPEARPQSGIADAPFVIEAPVEGGRTRFLAMFPLDADVREIGPVRSARPYFAILARAFHAPLVHVGGSPEALDFLRATTWPHVNQYYDPPFRRVVFRIAPFNVYTAITGLAEIIRGRGWEDTARSEEWGIVEGADIATATPAIGQSLHIDWSGNPVTWTYDAATKQYLRTQGDRAHRDANGKQVTAANVLILKIGTRVLDEIGRLAFVFPTDLAPNAAELVTSGKRASGHWAFRGDGQAADGQGTGIALSIPLRIAPGTTWIELVPDGIMAE